ncbi:MAG: XVIPCD domain-containing protein [Lysobacteraceae bacterium]
MADTPVFQGHHVIEQEAYAQSRLLKALSEQGLFDLHGPRNILNLPADQALATRLGVSPHPGGPLSGYSSALQQELIDLQRTPDGQATLRGDRAAAERMALRVGELTDTLKTGLVNGDLVTNTPEGMTREQANRKIRNFFGDLDGYRQTHATQVAEIGRMPANEARWAAVTRTEGNVTAALDAIEQPGAKPVAGERAAGRQSLGTAIAQANEAGRLPLSEPIEVRLRAAFPAEMPPMLARPPALPEVRGPLLEGGTVPETGTPGSSRAVRVVGAAGVALMAYDFVTTGHRVLELRAEGNEAAAASAQTHWVGRNAGGVLGGIGAGFLYGAVAGSETGPGALVTGFIGAGVGAYLGERWADQKDVERVFTQTDRNGNEWSRNPEDPQAPWSRTASSPNATGGLDETRFVAAGRLVDELNYRAANDSYSLGLGSPPRPQDPFTITGAQDQPGWVAGPWQRSAETGAWSRTLAAEGMLPELQIIPEMREDAATPAQTAELERQSALIVAQNAANSPASTAARYQIAYNQFGWNEFASMEPVPGAIRNASTRTDTLQASDGNTYTRAADGEWATPGMLGTSQATGNIREELNRTWQSQQAGLQEMGAYAAQALATPTPTQSDMRSMVAGAYASAGVVRSDADIDAATRAVAQDHARDGVGQSPYSLAVRPDGSIETLVGHNDRSLEVKSVTTAAEIEQARTQGAMPTETPPPTTVPSQPTQPPGAPTSDRAALDDGAHPRNGMFQQALAPVLMRDAELGRASDDASVRLAAGMTAAARERGLETIAFAQFSPDGQRFYISDMRDPTSPTARTVVGDVGQALQLSVADSTQRVAQLDRTQDMAQRIGQPAQQQTVDQGGQVNQGARLV